MWGGGRDRKVSKGWVGRLGKGWGGGRDRKVREGCGEGG